MTDERKIWEFRVSGEREWVAAETVLLAVHTYCNLTDINTFDFDKEDEVVEVPREKWPDIIITDEYGIAEMTFEQWMATNKGRDMIATTLT
jgi:hypothetical protein